MIIAMKVRKKINKKLNLSFTLVEILVAIAVSSVIATFIYSTFWTVSIAWRKGFDLSETLHHGDFIIEQLVTALRSIYYPDIKGASYLYGFYLKNNGNDADATDLISFVKIGNSFLGAGSDIAGTPHRIEFTVGKDENQKTGALIRAWRIYGQPVDFKPEKLPWQCISGRVTGFNCRVARNNPKTGKLEWLEEWEETNRVPLFIELNIYLAPSEKSDTTLELKRMIQIPSASLSWQ